MEKPVAVKFVIKSKKKILDKANWKCFSEIQGYQMTYTTVDTEVKLVTMVTTKFLGKPGPITKSNLLDISF